MKTTLKILALLGFIPLMGNVMALVILSTGNFEKLNIPFVQLLMGIGSLTIIIIMATMFMYGLDDKFLPTKKEMEEAKEKYEDEEVAYFKARKRLNVAIFELAETKKKYEDELLNAKKLINGSNR